MFAITVLCQVFAEEFCVYYDIKSIVKLGYNFLLTEQLSRKSTQYHCPQFLFFIVYTVVQNTEI